MLRIFLLLCVSVMMQAAKPEAAWTLEANGDVKWHRVTAAGTYLYATDNGVYSVDVETGQPLWKREDLKKVPDFAIEEVPGVPLLFVADDEGKLMKSTKMYALDIMTGKSSWETDKLQGQMADLFPDYGHNAIVLVATGYTGKARLQVLHVDFGTGKVNWELPLEVKVDLYLSEKGSKFAPRMDLNGHAAPAIAGDALYLAYAGLHKVNLKTGKLEWGVGFDVTEKTLKNTNASPVVAGGLVYSSAKGVIRAYDEASGTLRWRYEGAKESITNMHLDREAGVLLVADAKNLIGLRLDASGNKVKESYRLPLEFKFKSSGAKKAAKMARRFAMGGIAGMARKDKSDEDTPIALVPRMDGQLIVRGKQHLLLFDPKAKKTGWGSAFKAPGISNFAKVMTVAAFAMQYAYHTGQAASTYRGTSENRWHNDQRFAAINQFEKAMAKRYSAAALSSRYAYMLTDVDTEEGDGPGIVGVNLENGEVERELLFGDREPDYVIDEKSGMVVRTHKGKGGIIAQMVRCGAGAGGLTVEGGLPACCWGSFRIARCYVILDIEACGNDRINELFG